MVMELSARLVCSTVTPVDPGGSILQPPKEATNAAAVK
jgi:hypothetical protein